MGNIDISVVQNSVEDETNLEISTFHFSEKLIQGLKERSGTKISFVAVSAQFWRCVMKAPQVPENEPVYFTVAIDFIGRVKPPLPPTYFGNCVCSGIVGTTAKQLLAQDIVFVATLIQELVSSCAAEVHINNFVDFVESRLGSGNIDPIFGNLCNDYVVMTFMSPKFRIYEIDHGWGKASECTGCFLERNGKDEVVPRKRRGKEYWCVHKTPSPSDGNSGTVMVIPAID